MRRFVLLVSLLAGVVGCAAPQTNSSDPALGALSPPTTVEPSNQEIADRVDRAYREARFIQLEGTTTRVGHTLRFEYVGTQDSFRAVVFEGTQLYSAFAFHNGRIQELVPDHPKRLLLIYDSDWDDQIGWFVYERPLDCLIGGPMTLWIGPKRSDYGLLMTNHIREGRLLGREIVEGRACHVVEWEHQWSPDETGRQRTIKHVYYIDVQDSVLRRYDTIRDTADIQTRTYHVMDLQSDAPEVDWNIWPLVEGFVQPKPGAASDTMSPVPEKASSNSKGGSDEQ